MADGVILTPGAFEQVKDTVERVNADPRYRSRPQPERKRFPPAAATCSKQNAILQISVLGSPTGGTFDWFLTVSGNEETLTFNWDDTAAEVKTEIATHADVASSDLTVTGGDFPDATIQVEFGDNLANTPIAVPTADWSSLTGGSGVGVITTITQLGIA